MTKIKLVLDRYCNLDSRRNNTLSNPDIVEMSRGHAELFPGGAATFLAFLLKDFGIKFWKLFRRETTYNAKRRT